MQSIDIFNQFCLVYIADASTEVRDKVFTILYISISFNTLFG